VNGELKAADARARFLAPLVLGSAVEATAKGHSLALIRPTNTRFVFRRKPASILELERDGYRKAAQQQSFLDKELEALTPAPYAFSFSFEDAAGKHTFRCNDWETHTTFWKWTIQYGEAETLRLLSGRYNEEYPQSGMVFGLGTVKARPKQRLLLGIIRLNFLSEEEKSQGELAL